MTAELNSKDKWFIQTLRVNGVSISDKPSNFELVVIKGENDIQLKQMLFTTELYLNGKLIGEYADFDLDSI
ncbi:hypothetical protein [Halalkalibacter oceani]|uniref:hypothetical protein n=1 Tax=Halalkalibacter oceani TaxID=1653776 RepID=UPI0033977986